MLVRHNLQLFVSLLDYLSKASKSISEKKRVMGKVAPLLKRMAMSEIPITISTKQQMSIYDAKYGMKGLPDNALTQMITASVIARYSYSANFLTQCKYSACHLLQSQSACAKAPHSLVLNLRQTGI